MPHHPPPQNYIDSFLRLALKEDIGAGDITTDALFGKKRVSAGGICVAREGCRVAGVFIALRAFQLLDKNLKISFRTKDGADVKKGRKIFEIRGSLQALLSAERTALNILGHLSGIATLTRAFVKEIARGSAPRRGREGAGAVLLDTRKTTPLIRALEKYAVRVGGGTNHRFGLDGAILIKENHITAAGGIAVALKKIKETKLPAETEVKNLSELRLALRSGARWILLDNFSVPQLKKAVSLAKGKATLEASGGVTLKNIRRIAETGVNFISSGAITHSAPSANFSFLLK